MEHVKVRHIDEAWPESFIRHSRGMGFPASRRFERCVRSHCRCNMPEWVERAAYRLYNEALDRLLVADMLLIYHRHARCAAECQRLRQSCQVTS